MHRRGFFKGLFGGATGAVAAVAVGTTSSAVRAEEPKPWSHELEWREDKHIVTCRDYEARFPYLTSAPVAANSLDVRLNGLILVRGKDWDYVTKEGPFNGAGEPFVAVELSSNIRRPGDLIRLRYQTQKGQA